MRFYRPIRLGSGKAISSGALLCVAFGILLGQAMTHGLPRIAGTTAETADLCGYIVTVSSLIPAAVLQMRHRRQRWQALMTDQTLAAEIAKFRRETAERQHPAGTLGTQPPPKMPGERMKTGRP